MSEFFKDLLKAQQEIEPVTKDDKNPFFKNDFASLNKTILTCKQVLNDNNILVLQPIQSDENGVYVCTTLIHTSGDMLESKQLIREAKSNDPQAQGSAITYARRYSLKSFLCMTDRDDDGEKAQTTYRKPIAKPEPMITKVQETEIDKLVKSRGRTISEVCKIGKIKSLDVLTKVRADKLITHLKGLPEATLQ